MAEERVQRRLAAILAADVVGYSRLIRTDETGTRARFNAHFDDLIAPKVEEHHGRIFNTSGDGLLAEFGSVVNAVQCAVEFQRGMAERNRDADQETRMDFRIGLHLGDVIVEGEDIHGDGVNVAARLEGLAEPGGICVSANVYDAAEGKRSVGFEDLGEQEVKNIDRPIRAYRVHLESTAANPVRSATRHTACVARQAVYRGTAIPEYVRRSRTGVFLGRHNRGHHHRTKPHPADLRDRPQYDLHLQRGRRSRCRPSLGNSVSDMCRKGVS